MMRILRALLIAVVVCAVFTLAAYAVVVIVGKFNGYDCTLVCKRPLVSLKG